MVTWLVWLACNSSEKDSTIAESEDAFTPMDWQRGVADLESGDRNLRAIVHLHSHHSHDACDGDPQPDGVPDEACLGDLREALCTTKIDVAFLSDHPTHSTEVSDFKEVFLIRDQDEPYYDSNGVLLANRMNCADGHRTWIFAGVEASAMMPLGLQSHLTEVYEGGYDGSETAVEWVHAQNAISWVAHTETRMVEELVGLQLHGLEFYQLHANLDPDLRADYLGLEPLSFLSDVQPFFFPRPEDGTPPHPDLGFLAFVEPNLPSIEKMEALGLRQPIGISAGTDAHQNVFPNTASDGERIDSYRRMMRWFNTRIQVQDSENPVAIRDALRNRQTWIAFEVFGTPSGFSMVLVDDGSEYPMGSERNFQAGQQLNIDLPILSPTSPHGENAPNIEGRLYFIDENGRQLLHTWSEGTYTHAIQQTGIYRLEVWIQPLHLTPYLGDFPQYCERWVPWIYSGAFFIRENVGG